MELRHFGWADQSFQSRGRTDRVHRTAGDASHHAVLRLQTLYFSSLREGLSADELVRTPLTGGLFKIELGVAGTPTALSKG